jgi:Kef-type K+ transport system membrane component KefB
MENDNLNKLWDIQANDISNFNPKEIITKAKKQRNSQYISITVMSLTVMVLIIYAFYYAFSQWNTFNLGLILMISSLTFRIVLELFFLYRKEKQLISMAQKAYRAYLKKYYKARQMINYVITPICVIVYIIGFYLLLPYFKEYFSQAFYNYIVISGIISLTAVIAIIINSTIKEQRFLKRLNK